ncbi:glucosaminidase domain-containing protein [Myroides odoratimimus]|uniref:glucosaminidase domain-containing protein n=1 Tax=Myroides odoratimimus TaxID=76832 RepID=UPI00257894C8|nr:glucosaminidase domain-containing protein [Myroides odoratimimus]MDM1057861.1 glucosaminidase domain-containing protein [Myroides odoratimimus]
MGYVAFDELSAYEDNASKYLNDRLADAKTIQDVYGMDYRIPLTVSAVETGWGKHVKGFSYFGIKYGANDKQLITTTEYSAYNNLKFPEIISISPVVINGKNMYKYVVKDWFVIYKTPYDSFKGYYKFLEDNPRYKTALQFKDQPLRFFEEVAKAGYATAPNYADTLKQVYASVVKRL